MEPAPDPVPGGELQQELRSLGAQRDFRFTLLSNLELTLSLGWAAAVQEGRGPRDEFMISLKIL